MPEESVSPVDQPENPLKKFANRLYIVYISSGKDLFMLHSTYIFLLAGAALLSLSGCCNTESFFAVSSATHPDGGIYSITGNLPQKQVDLPSANYLIAAPDGKNFYASLSRLPGEKRTGGVAHLQLSADKKLLICQQLAVPGNTPCHLTLSPDEKYLYCANYGGGSITEIKLQDHHFYGKPRIIKHTGKSIHKRQKSPHPHFAAFDQLANQLYICDLGTDEIWIYNYDLKRGIDLPCAGKIPLPPGSGPRHLTFAPDGLSLYTADELNSTAASFVRKDAQSPWRLAEIRSTLPENVQREKNYPGAIKISSDGRFFFITNRGNDSIAVFAVQGCGKFKLHQVVPANGNYPSDILLLDNDRKMYVVNLKSNNISTFSFNPVTGDLTPEKNTIPLQKGMALYGF